MTDPKPTIGGIVRYTLSKQDADAITNSRATDTARGNRVAPGDVFPLMITRVWGDQPDSAVNGQVHLDGRDLHWVTSVRQGDGEGQFMWPARG